jgi:hypothetical protein
MRCRQVRTEIAGPVPGNRITVRGFTVPQLAAAVSLFLVLAFVVPALVATFVQRRRVARAIADVTLIATALREVAPATLTAFPSQTGMIAAGSPLRTLVGPGELPTSPRFPEWLTGRTDTLANQLASGGPPTMKALAPDTARLARRPLETGADPWGNSYLINIGAASAPDTSRPGLRPPRAIWVLSAGSNGVVETPYDQPASTAIVGGDDVAVRVWR